MSSEDYRTSESFETYRSSEEALQRTSSESEHYTEQLFPATEIEREIEDEHYDDFESCVEILVEAGKKELKPLQLTDCYTSDRPGMYLEILPKIIFETVEIETGVEEIDFPKPIFRLTIDQGTIATVEHTSNSAQTSRSKLLNSWCQCEPRLFSEEDCAATINSEPFNGFLRKAEKGIFESLIQNKTADSFFWELKSLHGETSSVETSKDSTLTMKGSFVCFEGDHEQTINFISWHPNVKDIFMVTTQRNKTFKDRLIHSILAENDSYTFYVWSCKNQFMPKVFLEYLDEINLHRFHPSIPNIVIGGSLSGQLIMWNLEEEILLETSEDKDMNYFEGLNSAPDVLHHSAVSNADYNHTRGITDLVWVPSHFEVTTRGNIKLNSSKDSYQIATCGSDGVIKFWDLRTSHHKSGMLVSKMIRRLDGVWEPLHAVEIQLEVEKKSFSITKFVFRDTYKIFTLDEEREDLSEEDKHAKARAQISTEFFAGCDDGQIFCGNFKLFRDEAGKFRSQPPKLFKSSHSGSITALALSPFIYDVFISTGSRTVSIWKYDILGMPIFSRDMHAFITSAEWSNIRPALFFLGYEDGSIEAWDLLENIYEPFLIDFVSTTSITAISVQTVSEEEHVLAVGDFEGIVYVLSLPSNLWMPVDSELKLMEEFVSKEAVQMESSCKASENTLKSSEVLKVEENVKIEVRDVTPTDEELQKNYEQFLELEKTHSRYLGIIVKEQRKSIVDDLLSA